MDRLSVVVGDITKIEVDAIVNAANEWMLGGGGVDGAIHAAAGPQLLAACEAIAEVSPGIRCPVGEARITPAFSLPAKFVIHTVGPRWWGGKNREPELLVQCYRTCLQLAVENGIQSIAFPAISTGAFEYPLVDACRIAVSECAAFLSATTLIQQINLVAFRKKDAVALLAAISDLEGKS